MSKNSRGRVLPALSWIALLLAVIVLAIWFARLRVNAADFDREIVRLVAEAAHLESTEGSKVLRGSPGPPSPPMQQAALATRPSPTPTRDPRLFTDRDLLGDPDLAPIIVRRHRRFALADLRQAIDAMNLSAADRAKVKDLVAARYTAREDAGQMVRQMGGASPELLKKATDDAQSEADQRLRALLGENGFARLQEANDVSMARRMNMQLTNHLWDAGAPLSVSQAESLARAQYEVGRSHSGGAGNQIDAATGLKVSEAQILQKASQFLSPAQIEFIREQWKFDARLLKATRDLESLRNATKGGGR